jgi:hypothetical protein
MAQTKGRSSPYKRGIKLHVCNTKEAAESETESPLMIQNKQNIALFPSHRASDFFIAKIVDNFIVVVVSIDGDCCAIDVHQWRLMIVCTRFLLQVLITRFPALIHSNVAGTHHRVMPVHLSTFPNQPTHVYRFVYPISVIYVTVAAAAGPQTHLLYAQACALHNSQQICVNLYLQMARSAVTHAYTY